MILVQIKKKKTKLVWLFSPQIKLAFENNAISKLKKNQFHNFIFYIWNLLTNYGVLATYWACCQVLGSPYLSLGNPSSGGQSDPRPAIIARRHRTRGPVRFRQQLRRRVRASWAGAWGPEAERGGVASAGCRGRSMNPQERGGCVCMGRMLPGRHGPSGWSV